METGTSTMPIKRRLTAILAADAVGYSRQMSENEEAALRVLTAQRAIIDSLIVAHEGRIFSTAGDSVLAEFIAAAQRWRGRQSQARYEGPYREGRYELTGFHGNRRCAMTIRMESHP